MLVSLGSLVSQHEVFLLIILSLRFGHGWVVEVVRRVDGRNGTWGGWGVVGRDDGSGAGWPKGRGENMACMVVSGENCRTMLGDWQGRGQSMNGTDEKVG